MTTEWISQNELADTATLTPKNAAGMDDWMGTDGLPITVEVYGPGSKQGRSAAFKEKRSSDLRMFRGIRNELPGNDAEMQASEKVEKLVAITKAISANCPLTPRELFSNAKFCYVNRQVDEFFGKEGNFMKGPSRG